MSRRNPTQSCTDSRHPTYNGAGTRLPPSVFQPADGRINDHDWQHDSQSVFVRRSTVTTPLCTDLGIPTDTGIPSFIRVGRSTRHLHDLQSQQVEVRISANLWVVGIILFALEACRVKPHSRLRVPTTNGSFPVVRWFRVPYRVREARWDARSRQFRSRCYPP